MSDISDPETTVADICDHLGRKEIAMKVGRRVTAVSNAVVEGVFPASWFTVIEAMCAAKGISCPRRLFNFLPVTETQGDAA